MGTTYAVSAVVIALFADQIVTLFADDPTSAAVPIATNLVYAACVAVLFQGVTAAAAGPSARRRAWATGDCISRSWPKRSFPR